jgi:shikimate kinase
MAIDHRPSTIDRIALVGFMGAGKTTVGRMLAERLQLPFVDLDDRIGAREGRDIPAIFRESGEAYFRTVESECLQALLEEGASGLILALGGGAFVQPNNAALLREFGFRTVFLDARVDELRQRCAEAGASRPLYSDANLFRQLYEARRGGYMAADVRVDTDGMTPQQVVEKILGVRC